MNSPLADDEFVSHLGVAQTPSNEPQHSKLREREPGEFSPRLPLGCLAFSDAARLVERQPRPGFVSARKAIFAKVAARRLASVLLSRSDQRRMVRADRLPDRRCRSEERGGPFRSPIGDGDDREAAKAAAGDQLVAEVSDDAQALGEVGPGSWKVAGRGRGVSESEATAGDAPPVLQLAERHDRRIEEMARLIEFATSG